MKLLSSRLGVILVIIGIGIFVYEEVWGADQFERPTLRGLEGVNVLVAELNPDAEADGLARDQLLMDVELPLRKAGIRVLTDEERLKISGMPYLHVNVTANKGALLSKFYTINIAVSLIQGVLLERDPSIRAEGITWQRQIVTGCGDVVIKSHVRNGLRDLIDEFIKDYLGTNLK